MKIFENIIFDIYNPQDASALKDCIGFLLNEDLNNDSELGTDITRAYCDIDQVAWFERRRATSREKVENGYEFSYYFFRVFDFNVEHLNYSNPWKKGMRWRWAMVTAKVERIKYKTEFQLDGKC